jgi:hypothetical protein
VVSDHVLVVLDSLLRAASGIRRTCDALRNGLIGALDDEVAVGHARLQADVGEFVERWWSGLEARLRGQHDIADRLGACVASYASTDQAATDRYVAAMSSPP